MKSWCQGADVTDFQKLCTVLWILSLELPSLLLPSHATLHLPRGCWQSRLESWQSLSPEFLTWLMLLNVSACCHLSVFPTGDIYIVSLMSFPDPGILHLSLEWLVRMKTGSSLYPDLSADWYLLIPQYKLN